MGNSSGAGTGGGSGRAGESLISLCSVCSKEVVGAEADPQPSDILFVKRCRCCCHKLCFLEILAKQFAGDEWSCPGCEEKPVRGYSYVPSTSESGLAEYLALPIKHACLASAGASALAAGLAPDRAVPIPMTLHLAGLTPMQREYLSQPKEWREKNCYFATMYTHPRDETAGAFVEALLGPDASNHAAEVLKYIMLFINNGVVQDCADLVQPPMHSLDEVLQAALVNRSLLHEMVHTLCTKHTSMPDEVSDIANTAQQSIQLAVFVITELMLKIERPHRPEGSGIQGFFAEMRQGHQVSKVFWDLLTHFKVASSRHVLKRRTGHMLADDLQYGNLFATYGLHLLLYDNIGFKKRAGYEQTVALFWVDVPASVLLRDGVYSASRERPAPHSRLRTAIMYRPEAGDYVKLHTRTRSYMEMVLGCMEILPTAAELQNLAVDYELCTEVPHRLPCHVRESAVGELPAIVAELEVELTPDEEEIASDHYTQNYIRADNVLMRDLNSSDCVVSLVEYAMGVVQKSLEQGKGLSEAADVEEQRVAGLGASPVLRMEGDKLLRDPRQTEDEAEEYLLAQYASAIRGCAAHLQKVDVSCEEVEGFMIERAQSHAAVFDVYLGMQWLNVLYMVRDSEGSGERGNLELFQQAQRLLTILFAITHATKYVRIHTDERYRWAHASDAEYLVQKNHVFTRKTAHGKPIFTDRLMEWFVRDVRVVVRKHWSAGKGKSISETVRLLPLLVQRRQAVKLEGQRVARSLQQTTSRQEARESQRVAPISNTFKAALLVIEKLNIWGPGPPRDKQGGELNAAHCFAGKQVNLEHLKQLHTGERRVSNYAAEFKVEDAPRLNAV
ncbi:hypothetical protein B484DRAFT_469778 [Ochromonadaceae sp. CCMP2298]|nr:hypothetical protein B484DRAFT_469778 [Ochromonadaceae sp. CCMP2298]